jgi:hypothetical protein
MADDVRVVLFPASYWPGGSADLGLPIWYIGYEFDFTTQTYGKLVTGVAGPEIIFGGTLPTPIQPPLLDFGGTLSGNLTCASFSMQGGAPYTLDGILSASSGTIVSGTRLTLGADAILSHTGALTVDGSVTNGGTIAGNALSVAAAGVALGMNGGSVINLSTGTISGFDGVTSFSTNSNVAVVNPNVTVLNAGRIIGDASFGVAVGVGVVLYAGGTVINQSTGTISGFVGILSGAYAAAVVNNGTIAGNRDNGIGVSLNTGGSITNAVSASITGGIQIGPGAWTVINQGSIDGGISLGPGGFSVGKLTNDGTLSGFGTVNGTVANDGNIEAYVGQPAIANGPPQIFNRDTLDIIGNVTGNGGFQVDANATLEFGGSFAPGETITFVGPGPHTLILDHPEDFQGAIAGIGAGDKIVLRSTGAATSNEVVAATIGELNLVQMLQIREAPDTNPRLVIDGGQALLLQNNITIDGVTNGGDLSGDYFQVTQSVNGADTTLTLAQGNPVALAVDAPEGLLLDVSGSGIKIGVISVGVELFALGEIVNDIAPDADLVNFDTGGTDDGLASAIRDAVAAGCRIIVDDMNDFQPTGDSIDQAIDDAVATHHVTYITAAGNDRDTPSAQIFGHRTNLLALTVAAMNILAVPSATPAGVVPYMPTQTEPFSSIGVAGTSKPDITGPDGGPTTQDLSSPSSLDDGLDPFFGTSAAAAAVAGVAALMMSKNQALESQPDVVDRLLKDSATRFSDASAPSGISDVQKEGAGLVDAVRAVDLAARLALGFAGVDTTTGRTAASLVQAYTGPVSGLQNEYLNSTPDSLNASVSSPNWFIHTGSGTDAIAVSGGTNVLDGGTGSNFLTGGSGTDTFFVDDRAATADIWSTVNNFHAGDSATIWGVTQQDFALTWLDGQGAVGYTGLTLTATAPGKPSALLTLTGYSQADLSSGRVSVLFGTDQASGSAYMYIHQDS